jgi:zinc transporter, ZIP family
VSFSRRWDIALSSPQLLVSIARINLRVSLREGLLEATALGVFITALITDLACGLGALPFFFTKSFSRRWLSPTTAIAAGLMVAASFGLVYEGLDYSALGTSMGALLGLGFIVVSRSVLGHRHEGVLGMDNASGTKALVFIGVMTIHSATEGII